MTIYDFRTFPKPPSQLDDDIEAPILYLKREIYDKPYPYLHQRICNDLRSNCPYLAQLYANGVLLENAQAQ